jgi:uncharacterized protein
MVGKHVRKKQEDLLHGLKRLGSVLVAFSGGLDSTFLLAMAERALGKQVLAVTARSPIHPSRETEEAASFCRGAGIPHMIVPSREMTLPQFLANPPNRCYHCKRQLFKDLARIAAEKRLAQVVHGANVDDLQDLRPGFRAAREAGVLAPLMDAQLDKSTIRELSQDLGLPTWNKAPMSCLATRIPYGTPITSKSLGMVEAAEQFLLQLGLQDVRVRHHGSLAKIEVGSRDIGRVLAPRSRKAIVEKFQGVGFRHVALDLEGYISGKMNRGLSRQESEE